MGLFSLASSRKPVGGGLSSKAGLSSGWNNKGTITPRELKRISVEAKKTFGVKRGSDVKNLFMGDMDGGKITASEANKTLSHLGKNRTDRFSDKDVKKIQGLISSHL